MLGDRYDNNCFNSNRTGEALFDVLFADSASRRCCRNDPCRRAAMVSHSSLLEVEKTCFLLTIG